MKIKKMLLAVVAVSALLPLQAQPTKEEVKNDMFRVANWQVANYVGRRSDLNWENGVCLLGISKYAAFAEKEYGDTSYYKWLQNIAERHSWNVNHRRYHADDVVIGQFYMQLYDRYKEDRMIAPAKKRAEWVIANYPKTSLIINSKDSTSQFRWSWCDALFMAPNLYLELYNRTGDKKFIKFMDKEFKATTKFLYDKEDSLFYRDCRYFPNLKREANGKKIFWGRGNGWVAGGLAEILRELPKTDKKYRPFYQKLFVEMAYRIAELQGEDGFWRASMLDPGSYPSPETSSSGFFVYALAYGVNEGLLPRDKFLPVVYKGWKALVSAVEDDGKLGYVQPIGADPKKVTREMTEVYGPAAFLMSGLELLKLAKDEGDMVDGISTKRIKEIAAMLPDRPETIGISYKNREVWDKLRSLPESQDFLKEKAPKIFADGMPPFSDSLYLDLNKSNYRPTGERMMNKRFSFIFYLTLAECMENQGRYVEAISKAMVDYCKQIPWTIPAHDRDLQVFHGTNFYADLVVNTTSNGFAQCVGMLDDKLPVAVKDRLLCALDQKLFRPVHKCLCTDKKWWWFTGTNNWNSVCLGGMVGTALSIIPDKFQRAYFVAVAEKYSPYGMKGYVDDGYCSEGVGYYNYGFRAYCVMREQICRATKGQIDLFRNPKFVRIANYGDGIQMAPQVCSAYSDGHIGAYPSPFLIDYCKAAFGRLDKIEPIYGLPLMGENFSLYLLEAFPNPAWKMDLTPEIRQELAKSSNPLRTKFELAGVYVVRPQENSSCRISASFKGGNNAENHNHNDIGSYDVALGKVVLSGDQGGPGSYPGDYFGGGAYEKYALKGSYGHPVPVIAGVRQHEGKSAKGVVTTENLNADKDVVTIDCKSAYKAEGLQSYDRTFTYDRSGTGLFSVNDAFTTAAPTTFETALTTSAEWKQTDKNHIELTRDGETMKVTIEASGAFTISEEKISVNCAPYSRIGIALKKPASQGFIKLTYAAK